MFSFYNLNVDLSSVDETLLQDFLQRNCAN